MKRILCCVLLLAVAGCAGRDRETRTFLLRHLDSEAAVLLIEPYLGAATASMRRTDRPAAVTITAAPEHLDRIDELLRRYDVPVPGVVLNFQVIEADGFTESDPAIKDVEASLRELFRFRGYRLVGEAMVRASSRTNVSQALTGPADRRMQLAVGVGEVIANDERRAVELHVQLDMDDAGSVIATGVTVPDGQQVVLGSSRPVPGMGALILVVRPQIE